MSSHVHKLHSSSGEPVQHTSRIASVFRDYYAALYDLDSNASPTDLAQKQTHIEAYLSSSGFLILSPVQLADLELPISPAELLATVCSLPNRKSPGPDG